MVMNIKPKVVSFNSASKNQIENVHTKSHTAETRNISKISKNHTADTALFQRGYSFSFLCLFASVVSGR